MSVNKQLMEAVSASRLSIVKANVQLQREKRRLLMAQLAKLCEHIDAIDDAALSEPLKEVQVRACSTTGFSAVSDHLSEHNRRLSRLVEAIREDIIYMMDLSAAVELP